MKLFFSYGHDANKPLVEMIKQHLEEWGYIIWNTAKWGRGKGFLAAAPF